MKKFTLLFAVLCVFFLNFTYGQSGPAHRTCSTDDAMQKVFENDPQARQRYERLQQQLESQMSQTGINRQLRTQAIVNVPVVVHIILPDPNLVTLTTIQNQLDTLNWFFGNASTTDSLRVYTPFRTTYGRSNVRFCLAVRDPNNQATTGVIRVTSNTTFTSGGAHPSTVSAAWNTNAYLNIWVVSFGSTGILGYSYLPGTFAPGDQRAGFVNDYRAFGSNAPYLFSSYNLGRTAVHEIGHYFNLNHTWGPNNSSNPTCTLSDGCDDTPPTNGPTYGCPASPVTNSCSPSAPGIMFQNHMDYADDACMFLFTQCQATRIDNALNAPDRIGLTTSNGCQPVVVYPYDAAITAIINPASGQQYCGVTSINPTVTLTNYGTNTLTSATITVQLNSGTVVNIPWAGSLATNASTNVNLPAVTVAGGNHTIAICVTNINGGQTDGNSSNNCRTNSFGIIAGGSGGINAPFSEGFEGTTFQPAGWDLTTTGTATQRWNRVTTAAKTGTASAMINWYSITNGVVSNLTTPLVNLASGNYDNAKLTFHYAYKLYSLTSFLQDTLDVQISTDCGASWVSVWKKGGTELPSTSGTSTSSAWVPLTSDWTQMPVEVDLTPYRNGIVSVRFRARSGLGQKLYLDDINITGSVNVNNDAGVSAINAPAAEVCGSTITPQVVVRNNGVQVLTSVQVVTRIDNGTPSAPQTFNNLLIAPGATQTFTLNNITGLTAGNHTLTAYTVSPNGVLDQQPSNDTLRKQFNINLQGTLPVTEGFEGATFPPAGWKVIQAPGDAYTWSRTTAARKSGTAAAWINHYNYNAPGALDYLVSPLVNFASYASAKMSFQYAYKMYDAASADSLAIVVSTDCGATWSTPLWNRGGANLATAPGTLGGGWTPTAAEWTSTPIEIDLTPYVNSGPIYIAFRSKNSYGQNLYIDDINIIPVYNRDILMKEIVIPSSEVCDASATPKVTIRNVGTQTITSLKVNYTVDGGTATTTTFTGMSLGKDRDTTLTLATANGLAAGNHTFKVWSFDPNGQNDENPVNDTATRTFTVLVPTTAPLVQGFEDATFPPTGWQIKQNPTDATTWARTNVGKASNNSAYMNNFAYAFLGRVDDLVTPPVKFGAVDSVFLKFDVAAYTYSYPGSTAINMDTLKVMVTTDCGASYTPVYVKYGADLQTVGEPNAGGQVAFRPLQEAQWRTDSINLTSMLRNGASVRIAFRNIENYENNIYLDNINFYTETLPAKLKNEGFMITPSPFTTSFAVQHYLPPTNLKSLGVYDALGRQLVSHVYNGNAESYIHIDMRRFAAGMYTVKLTYENKVVAQRVIKAN